MLSEEPNKTTETTPERTTKTATKEPYDEDGEGNSPSENWKIGLSVGVVLFALLIGIGKYALSA